MELTMAIRISERRKEKGLTQKELADLVGVTDKAVSKWERGVSCPDLGLIPDVARALDLTTQELVEGARIARLIQEEGKTPHVQNQDLVGLVCRALALAMGVGAFVITLLGQGGQDITGLLGLGLAALALDRLREKET